MLQSLSAKTMKTLCQVHHESYKNNKASLDIDVKYLKVVYSQRKWKIKSLNFTNEMWTQNTSQIRCMKTKR